MPAFETLPVWALVLVSCLGAVLGLAPALVSPGGIWCGGGAGVGWRQGLCCADLRQVPVLVLGACAVAVSWLGAL